MRLEEEAGSRPARLWKVPGIHSQGCGKPLEGCKQGRDMIRIIFLKLPGGCGSW